MMPKRLRVALIGCGEIGTVRADAMSESLYVHLVITCDVEAIARKHSCGASADWQAVIAREDVDIVNVATPTHWHTEIAAAKHQKHVLNETK